MLQAVGTVLKSITENQQQLSARMDEIDSTPIQKSIQTKTFADRFASQGNENGGDKKVLSISKSKADIVALMDSKINYDEISKGGQANDYVLGVKILEAANTIEPDMIRKLAADFNVSIVD